MPELYSRQPEFTYSLCGRFTKHLGMIQKKKKKAELIYIISHEN